MTVAEQRLDTQYILTEPEWKLFESSISQVLRHRSRIYSAFKEAGIVRQIPFGTQTDEYYIYNDPLDAQFERRWALSVNTDELSFTVNTADLYSIIKGVYVDAEIIAAARNRGRPILQDNAREAAAKVAEKLELHLALGTEGYYWGPASNQPGGDFDLKGVFNTSGVNTLGAGGAGIGNDDDMTAAGDFVNTVGKMVSKLQEDKHYGDNGYLLICTPGLISQLALNSNATRGTTEWETVYEYMKESGNKFKIIMSKHIGEASAGVAAATQEMCLIDPDPNCIEIVESVPLGTKIELNTKKPGDVHFGVGWKGRLIVKDATTICISVTLTATNAY